MTARRDSPPAMRAGAEVVEIAAARPAHAVVNYRMPRHKRARDDWYVEPTWAVEKLAEAERFVGSVWDPACGEGTIPKAFAARGHQVFGSDLVDRGYGVSGVDFLLPFANGAPFEADNIVCNPPFKHAEEFILKALTLARLKVAMLVRLAFLEGQGRFARLYAQHRPARALVFCSRVSMPPGGQGIAAEGGAVAFQWIVWDHDHRGPTQMDWLP